MSEILAAKTGDSLADTNGKKVYKRKKVIKPFKVFKRRKVRLVSVTGVTVKNTNASCYYEPAVSRFGPVESPSTKATDAIGDDESIEMDVETNQPTCRNSLDVRSEVIKVMENKEATYVKLNEDKKAHVVSSIISYHNAEFFDYMNKDLKNIVVNIDKYDGFRESFIKCYTKFVLSVLDEEYLEQTYSMKELEKQSTLLLKDFMEFSENLQQSDTCEELEKQYASLTEQVAELRRNEVDNRGEFAKQFKYLLSHSNEITERLKINPIISAIVDGRINLSKYPLLREHDIGYILQMYEMKFPREDISHELRVCPNFGFHLCGVSLEWIGKDDIRMVRDAVVDFQDLAVLDEFLLNPQVDYEIRNLLFNNNLLLFQAHVIINFLFFLHFIYGFSILSMFPLGLQWEWHIFIL
ncbi:hypothetical protein O6P43_014574 [Quillaja saponaria]|uniref:Uncharacterized protein n=1 Tax=Quillaja saponaria TaxID=32244 RepID=A0AAD7LUZ3_QUISA|nr:hypothetical protein O6P43_014574 [Quillaja saponaria]